MYSRPNVSTLQSSVFIRGDLKLQRGFLYTQEVTSFANKVEIFLLLPSVARQHTNLYKLFVLFVTRASLPRELCIVCLQNLVHPRTQGFLILITAILNQQAKLISCCFDFVFIEGKIKCKLEL